MPVRLSERLKALLRVATMLIAVFHMVQTAIYVLPSSRLPPALVAFNHRYMNPAFTQTWTLFAPTPIRTNDTLLVHCLRPGQTLRDDQWFDVLSPLWRANQRLRLAAYGQLARTITQPILQVIHPAQSLLPLVRLCQKGDKQVCKKYVQLQTRITRAGVRDLVKVASVYCRDRRSATGERYERAGLRVRTVRPPDWAHRYQASAVRAKDYDLGTHALVFVNAPVIYASR